MTEIARPVYREGQYLSAADFVAEQAYHRQALGRHQVGEHTWGLVVGLELVEVADAGGAGFVDAFLTPGLAVDGYGRQLVSFSRIPIDPALFNAFLDTAHRSVWIQFAETDAAPTPDGYADCSQSQPTRAIETFRLVVDPVQPVTDVIVAGDVAIPEPAAGATIPADTSVPFQELPDEPPIGRWLVRLGSLLWDGGARRFRPAGSQLSAGRRFVGVVAEEILSPADTLRVARRTPTTVDDDEFATVEGRLRVQGRINAERELWLEGEPIRFTYDGGSQPPGKEITLGRDPGPSGGKDRLRLTLGAAASPDVSLSIGSLADAAKADPVAEVRADGRVRVPLGPLDLGTTHRQEVELKTAGYGFGTQEGVLYQRSPSMFAWYAGGQHSDTPLDPGKDGAGQQLAPRLVLDGEGALDFGAVTHQMLKLWSAPGTTVYGVGVQPWTLYFRTDADFCWFRDGSHVDVRSGAGNGGTLAMKLDDSSLLQVFGPARISGALTVGVGGPADLDVSGALRLRGTGQSAVTSVVKVITTNLVVQNGKDSVTGNGLPGSWTWSWTGQLDEVYSVVVMLNAFAMVTGEAFSADPARAQNVNGIPQNLWARVDGWDTNHAWGGAFCAQSDPTREPDNSVGITVVAIGRKLP